MKQYYDYAQDKYFSIEELEKDFEECKKIDSSWKECTLNSFIENCLDIGTLVKTEMFLDVNNIKYTYVKQVYNRFLYTYSIYKYTKNGLCYWGKCIAQNEEEVENYIQSKK